RSLASSPPSTSTTSLARRRSHGAGGILRPTLVRFDPATHRAPAEDRRGSDRTGVEAADGALGGVRRLPLGCGGVHHARRADARRAGRLRLRERGLRVRRVEALGRPQGRRVDRRRGEDLGCGAAEFLISWVKRSPETGASAWTSTRAGSRRRTRSGTGSPTVY